MINYSRFVIMSLTLMGDWYKPEQPYFRSENQALRWLRIQIAEELLEDDNDYYIGQSMGCTQFKIRWHKENQKK